MNLWKGSNANGNAFRKVKFEAFVSFQNFFIKCFLYQYKINTVDTTRINPFKLALFKEEQLPYRSKAASHVGAAVLAHVARSRRSEPLLDERSLKHDKKIELKIWAENGKLANSWTFLKLFCYSQAMIFTTYVHFPKRWDLKCHSQYYPTRWLRINQTVQTKQY